MGVIYKEIILYVFKLILKSVTKTIMIQTVIKITKHYSYCLKYDLYYVLERLVLLYLIHTYILY